VPSPNTFTIAVDGRQVGRPRSSTAATSGSSTTPEVDDSYEGRGLATILVGEALQATRAAGKRVVAVCTLVAGYLDKHRDFDDIVDPITDETQQFLRDAVRTG